MIIDGNEACSYTSYMFTEAAGIYPITPSSPMAENLEKWSNSKVTNLFDDVVSVVEMQSEAGASGLVHGLLRTGVLASTYTASQGLLLMIPNMYKMAGEMLPCVMHVAARSLSTHALSILGDHQDIYAARMTGFCMIASSSVSDAANLSAVAHLASLKSSLPFMHFFDGFRTSHEINKIDVLEKEDYLDLIKLDDLTKFKNKSLNPNNPKIYGTNQNDDIYFQVTESRNKHYDDVPDIVNDIFKKINEKSNNEYKPFNYYGSKVAKKIIVAMGSVNETIKEVIDNLDEEIGLIEVHLYRPFSKKYLLNVIPKTVNKVIVLDRTKEFGSREPLYLDVCEALKDANIKVLGGRYGLSSKDTTPEQIKAVFDNEDKDNFTIGITDDVTNLSLDIKPFNIKNSLEILIYGYGSDGMISASKSLIKLIGNNTNKYVQGYFQYDSKKSGGVTKSHLRISSDKIRSTYYFNKPDIMVVTKEQYLNSFDCIDMSDNGILLLNTSKTESELNNYLCDNIKEMLITKNIKVMTIDASLLSRKIGLSDKVSIILESALLSIIKDIDYTKITKLLKDEITKRFSLKDPKIGTMNNEGIDEAVKFINEVKIDNKFIKTEVPKYVDVYLAMRRRCADNLPVSAFSKMEDGEFEAATSKCDKRAISDIVPKWINSNCIKCNMCSFICPHSVIRPFMLSDEEYKKAPDYIKEKCIDNYIIGISVSDCTGCGLCKDVCLSKEKSIIYNKLEEEIKEQEVYDYLVKNVTYKENNLNTIKNSQFKAPKIEFSGACAGCGEVPYIKLLTQLFGDSLVIANATGCSSIYGASAPSMPYSVPWASSLFEDNAEYGFGMVISDKIKKNKIINIMKEYGCFDEYINNYNNYEITKRIYDDIDFDKYDLLKPYKDNIIARNIWTIGGDGWAYDIGFGGIDHVMSTNYNSKILVLDTQVYSNTGGQSSKATPLGSTALFASLGKENNKKDLAYMMMGYKHAYIAQVSLGNPAHLIKTLNEANNYDGPALIIAYSVCISHGIKGGMSEMYKINQEAIECGYFPLFRNNPLTKFTLDSKANFDLYEEFLLKQNRYSMLPKLNKNASELLKNNKSNAIERYEFYSKMN